MKVKILVVVAAALTIFSSCAVDRTVGAYGTASSCSPSANQIQAFYTEPFAFIYDNCRSCHTGTSVISGYDFSGFSPSDNESAQSKNFCLHYKYAISKRLSDYPRTNSHPGGNFSGDAGFQKVVEWVNNLK